MNNLLKPHS